MLYAKLFGSESKMLLGINILATYVICNLLKAKHFTTLLIHYQLFLTY